MIVINVVDENDNSPQFEKSSYVAVVAENRKIGSSILTIRASDPDSGMNGKVNYSMTGGDGKFEMNPNTGAFSDKSDYKISIGQFAEYSISYLFLGFF